MLNKKELSKNNKLTELDETVLFMTKPYAIASIVCFILAVFSFFYTWPDTDNPSLFISGFVMVVNFIFIIAILVNAKRIRKNDK